jgi:putative membrane protein
MRLIIRWVLNAGALMAIAYYLVPGIQISSFYTALIAALVLGLINALIKPILLVLTLPVNIITLGLFTFVINAALFWFASSIVKGFVVADFASAFWGALFLTVASWLVQILFGKRNIE